MNTYTLEQSWFTNFLFANAQSAPVWFLIRLYLGYEWVVAGYDKMMNPAWFGSDAGAAMNGFVQGALHKTAEFCTSAAQCHPDVQGWYAGFLKAAVLPHLAVWSHAITIGEILVGAGLIVGAFTGIAALFGLFMNLNFLLAGTVSVNPVMATLAICLILAWRVAGYWGVDQYLLPRLRPILKLHGLPRRHHFS